MIRNYFVIAWRNLQKNKAFSFLNISGLAIGMASAILILLWVQNEISYDQFHKNKEHIRCVSAQSLAGVIKRFCRAGADIIRSCDSRGLLFYESMAGTISISHSPVLVDFCFCRTGCTGDHDINGQLSIGKSGAGESGK